MSYKLEYTGKVKKDIKLAQKRGLNMTLLKTIITTLEKKGELTSEYKPHQLKGNYKGLWECHIQPDWLLIWEQNDIIN